MSPDNSKELINIYPELFTDLHSKTSMNLFGFECGDGWFDLLKDLILSIKEYCSKNEIKYTFNDEVIQIKVNQVKEKYGTLRFYTNISNESIDNLIDNAEHKSAFTCEECGKAGSMREKGRWYSVRCDECLNNGE